MPAAWGHVMRTGSNVSCGPWSGPSDKCEAFCALSDCTCGEEGVNDALTGRIRRRRARAPTTKPFERRREEKHGCRQRAVDRVEPAGGRAGEGGARVVHLLDGLLERAEVVRADCQLRARAAPDPRRGPQR